MKITKTQLAFMQDKINAVLVSNPNAVDNYEKGRFPRSDKVKDLQVRFCFDLASGAGLTDYFCSTLYPNGCNDTHITTALKKICPKVVKRY